MMFGCLRPVVAARACDRQVIPRMAKAAIRHGFISSIASHSCIVFEKFCFCSPSRESVQKMFRSRCSLVWILHRNDASSWDARSVPRQALQESLYSLGGVLYARTFRGAILIKRVAKGVLADSAGSVPDRNLFTSVGA